MRPTIDDVHNFVLKLEAFDPNNKALPIARELLRRMVNDPPMALGVGYNKPKSTETFEDVEPSLRAHAANRPNGVTACTMREIDRLRALTEKKRRVRK